MTFDSFWLDDLETSLILKGVQEDPPQKIAMIILVGNFIYIYRQFKANWYTLHP